MAANFKGAVKRSTILVLASCWKKNLMIPRCPKLAALFSASCPMCTGLACKMAVFQVYTLADETAFGAA
ncbi:hypothetical protein PPL_09132 [Heterostelium album PN500]|uniref:Uncharacterized protein n=1 Tax=Heterostelium pallidum (strain ATCC 26659 / Pp 5 / PN500) TaxID=670386 RepID=D3BKQ0_HETP5|nr:hypothetical protein PPL_09132 [Heterostelium album PN500]EFA78480.1 hypothetical protein PPL_09132 [Heterostelium album PN500]|eukprot:XP_020430604.1 hypothetical protein PPL_09132 [Heterostelium album PN500]